jgi:Putative MetA-pathway of phenol degradation
LNKSLKISAVILILFLFLKSNLIAQELETDRPDITESAITMYPGYLQIENGFVFENQKENFNGLSGKVLGYTISSILFRYGLPGNIELRAGGNYLYQKTDIPGSESSASGVSDFMLGAKFQFSKEEINDIDLGVLLQFHLPLGNKTFKPLSTEPEFLFALGKDLSKYFSLSANLGGRYNSLDEDIIYLYSVSLGIEINDKSEAFAEFYGDASKSGESEIKYDFGVTYQPVDNFQLDASAGTDSFSFFNDWFVGAGLSDYQNKKSL